MSRLASALEREGYRVLNLSYSSRKRTIESLANDWLPGELDKAGLAPPTLAANARVHFVTHSMGGIMVRLWLRDRGIPPHLGRVVMLAPPNAGSEVPDRLATFPPFRWFTGVNGPRLGVGPDSLPRTLGPWPASAPELGVIAGNRSLNPLFSSWLTGANDGKVTVTSTHLAGEKDHLVLPYSHTWLGWRQETIAQVVAFVAKGQFIRRDPRP
jgi:hypothetical protein